MALFRSPILSLKALIGITQAILRSLLWLAKREESQSPDFFDGWIKRLDWLVAAYGAGIQTP